MVTPDTILRWHRWLIAQKWTFGSRRPGRPGIMRRSPPSLSGWPRRILAGATVGSKEALRNLGHRVVRSTVAKVLKDHGMPPAPGRPSSLADVSARPLGCDRRRRLLHDGSLDCPRPGDLLHAVRAGYTLFVLDLKSRRVDIVGSMRNPDTALMMEAARRLTDAVDGFLTGHRVLICDRDGKWTEGFRALLEGAGVRIVLTPVQAPNANAYASDSCAQFARSAWTA
jgi:putative transposase